MLDLQAWHRDVTRLVDLGDEKTGPQLYPLMRSALAHRVMHAMSPDEKRAALEHVGGDEIALLKCIHDEIDDVPDGTPALIGELERRASPAFLAKCRARILASLAKAEPVTLDDSDPPPAA